MANPSGTHLEPGQVSSSFNGGGNPSNGSVTPASENSGPPVGALATATAMKHNPGIAMDWTPEEQSVLEEGLNAFGSDSNIIRYAKIAMQLQNKTVRDVALRCRWMSKKENSKRRKEDHNLSRKSKDKKEKVTEPSSKSSHLASRANVPPYAMPMIPMDNDDGISYKAIGGSTGQLLEQNAQAFSQISANLASLQIQDNISLFCQAHDNIQAILNDLNDMPEVMRQMPPLPVKMNEDLVKSILHRSRQP